MSCEIEVTNESARCWKKISSYTTRLTTDSRVKQSHWRCPYCICWYINTGDIAILDGIPGEVEILPELQYMENGHKLQAQTSLGFTRDKDFFVSTKKSCEVESKCHR